MKSQVAHLCLLLVVSLALVSAYPKHDDDDDDDGHRRRHLKAKVENISTNLEQLEKTVATLHNKVNMLNTTVFFSVGLNKIEYENYQYVVPYNKVFANEGNSFDVSTSSFTCQIAGSYRFDISLMSADCSDSLLTLQMNGDMIISTYARYAYDGSSNTVIMDMSVGDVVNVVSKRSPSCLLGYPGFSPISETIYTTFTGQLIKA